MPIGFSESLQGSGVFQDVSAPSGVKYEVSEEISETTAKCALVATTEAMIFAPSSKELTSSSFHLLDRLFHKHSRGLEDMDLLEVKFADPEIMLNSLYMDELEESISRVFSDKKAEILKELPNMTVGQFYSSVYSKIFSGSCGLTAIILETFLCGDYDPSFITMEDSFEFAMHLRNKVDDNVDGQWFCTVRAGGHAFLIEYSQQVFRIYQSFMGRYNLSHSLKTRKTYSIEEFLKKIQIALSYNPMEDEIKQKTINPVRRDLFLSQSVDGRDIKMQFLQHDSEGIIAKRIVDKLQADESAWSLFLNEPIKTYLNHSFRSVTPPSLPRIEYSDNDLKAVIKSQKIFDEELMVIPSDDLSALIKGATYYFTRFGNTAYELSAQSKEQLFIFEMIASN